jgi:hypothetical protein
MYNSLLMTNSELYIQLTQEQLMTSIKVYFRWNSNIIGTLIYHRIKSASISWTLIEGFNLMKVFLSHCCMLLIPNFMKFKSLEQPIIAYHHII